MLKQAELFVDDNGKEVKAIVRLQAKRSREEITQECDRSLRDAVETLSQQLRDIREVRDQEVDQRFGQIFGTLDSWHGLFGQEGAMFESVASFFEHG